MNVTCNVDIDLLSGCFELGPCHGLKKQSDDDTWEERTASGVYWSHFYMIEQRACIT